jgi:predicted transcriptional regulator
MTLAHHPLSGLKAERERACIDPTTIAAHIGVDLRSYYRYEVGARRIHFDKACSIADLLGCSLDALRGLSQFTGNLDTVVNVATDQEERDHNGGYTLAEERRMAAWGDPE